MNYAVPDDCRDNADPGSGITCFAKHVGDLRDYLAIFYMPGYTTKIYIFTG